MKKRINLILTITKPIRIIDTFVYLILTKIRYTLGIPNKSLRNISINIINDCIKDNTIVCIPIAYKQIIEKILYEKYTIGVESNSADKNLIFMILDSLDNTVYLGYYTLLGYRFVVIAEELKFISNLPIYRIFINNKCTYGIVFMNPSTNESTLFGFDKKDKINIRSLFFNMIEVLNRMVNIDNPNKSMKEDLNDLRGKEIYKQGDRTIRYNNKRNW